MIKLREILGEIGGGMTVKLYHGSRIGMSGGLRINYGSSIGNLTMGRGFYMTAERGEAVSYAMGGSEPSLVSGVLEIVDGVSKYIDIGRRYRLEDIGDMLNERGIGIIDEWDDRGYYQGGLRGIQFIDEVVRGMRMNMIDVGIEFSIRRDDVGKVKEVAIYDLKVLKSVDIGKIH